MGFDYFYEEQADRFTFYRIPKILFTDSRFRTLSIEGKVIYGLLLDRVSLSRENGWIDEEGRVYIIFTLNALREAVGCSEKSAIKYLTELEDFGLIERNRKGLGKPTVIYVKNFIVQENLQDSTCKTYRSAPVKVTGQELYFLQGNNTNHNDTELSNTNLILSDDEDRMRYESYLAKQLDIEILKKDHPDKSEMIDGIVDLILDVLSSNRQRVRIAGDEKPVNVVKSRFMKLTMMHILYVMDCMQKNKTKVRNIKQYLLATLYNAPATIESYYLAEVSHDMAENKV